MRAGFSNRQLKRLATPLDRARVQRRDQDGKTLSYIEGWFVISEANRIFGFDGWDREMVHFERVYERRSNEMTACGYVARVRVRVRAMATTVTREGTGFGQASAHLTGDAHERALKAAETDATKRALATFGGRFGLFLYDKDQSSGRARAPVAEGPLANAQSANTREPSREAEGHDADVTSRSSSFDLIDPHGGIIHVATAEAYCGGLRQLIEAVRDVSELEDLKRLNEHAMAKLSALPELKTVRGVHYVDVLERLFVRRRASLASGVTNASPPDPTCGAQSLSTPKALTGEGPQPLGRDTRSHAVDAPAQLMPEPAGAVSDMADDRGEDGGEQKTASLPIVDVSGLGEDQPESIVGADEGASQPGDSDADRATFARGYRSFVPVPPYPLAAMTERLARRGRLSDAESTLPDEPLPSPAGDGLAPVAAANATPPATRISQITGAPSIDKSVLALASDRRLRSKAHLGLVASKACVICEELPCHAHHLTFAQPRGLAQKVSDEFTVPLCVRHHNALHRSGSEMAWWRGQGIDPLAIARALWEESREMASAADGNATARERAAPDSGGEV